MTDNNKISPIPQKYAKALIDTAKECNSFENYKSELSEILQTLRISDDLKQVLENPVISNNSKTEILESVFRNKINDKILNLLKILVEKNRFGEFEEIVQTYNQMTDDIKNIKNVEIISSVELKEDTKEKILNKLQQKIKSEITPLWKVDKSLIAGLVFKMGDTVIDTSIKTKLKSLSNYILR